MSTDPPIRPERERRRGARFLNAEPHVNCTLLVGRKKLPACILDESAGGFRILLEEDPCLETDAVVRLQTSMASYEVRVANLGCGETDQQPSGYQLGLQRLRELEITLLPTDKTPWLPIIRDVMPATSLVGAFVIILALLIVAPVAVLGVMFGLDNVSLQQFATWTESAGYQAPSHEASYPSRRYLPVPASSESDVPRPAAPGVSSADSPRRPEIEQLRAMLAYTPGAEALLLPDVVKHLALSADQQQRLRELADATDQALNQFHSLAQGQSRQERSRKRELLFNEARQRALQLLTPEQRLRWNALQNP